MSHKYDLLVGIALIVASVIMIGAQVTYAIHHDCQIQPPLPSKVFGKSVPIEFICKVWRSQ